MGNKTPFPWLGAISAGSGIIGALSNIGARKKEHKRNIDLWRMNNEYNHPSSQMARLREAGLNPNLIYGDSVSGASGTSSSPPPTAEHRTANIGNPIANYQRVESTKLQNDNLRAQNTVLQADADLKAVQAIKTALEGDIKGIDKDVAEETINNRIIKIQAESETAFDKNRLHKQQTQMNLFTKKQQTILKQGNYMERIRKMAQNAQNLTNSEKLSELRQLEIQLKKDNAEYFQANAIIDIVGKLLGLRK